MSLKDIEETNELLIIKSLFQYSIDKFNQSCFELVKFGPNLLEHPDFDKYATPEEKDYIGAAISFAGSCLLQFPLPPAEPTQDNSHWEGELFTNQD